MGNIQDQMENLNLLKSGKVREIYDLGENILLVTSDRISAFDVVMNQTIPDKGKILTNISKFWFEKTSHIIKNHLISTNFSDFPNSCQQYKNELNGRSMLVKKAKTLPVEFVVRGYICGSGWKEYQNSGTVCGIKLPENLLEFQKLDQPLFTPSTKADEGHDENINFEQTVQILGLEMTEKLSKIAIELYKFGAKYLESKNLILADTKFEFGETEDGEIILIDEVMTPDSSRFWLKESYVPGREQYNFDKQILRDYLLSVNWNKTPPPPELPNNIIEKTKEKYLEAQRRILG